MTASLLLNASGLVALALNISGLLKPSDAGLRQKAGLAAALWALNNLLLGAYTAAALSVLVVARQFAAQRMQDASAQHRVRACAVFVLLTLLVGTATWQGWSSVFTVTGTVLATVAMFYLSGARLRLALLVTSLLWLGHAWVFHSIWQMVANVSAAAAAGVGAWSARRLGTD